MNRRNFVRTSALGGAALLSTSGTVSAMHLQGRSGVPAYLSAYKRVFRKDPHQAALDWFAQARFGLFMHYGLYSIPARGAWVQLAEKIPVKDYELLMQKFTAERFDAEYIARLAVDAGMKYVNITTKHHDGFCLFKTDHTEYQSLNTPAGRDLVAELQEACEKYGLGLFLYYSIAADWHYPWFCSPDAGWRFYRPDYAESQPQYRYASEADFEKYIGYVKNQIRELVIQYQPAGIWFDPVMGFYARPDLFPMKDIYSDIRKLSPHTLVSFKQGATGTEDFAAPEREAQSLADRVHEEFGAPNARLAEQVWNANRDKHNETCSTMQRGAWAFKEDVDGKNSHLNVDEVLQLLHNANEERGMNLLLNTGPLPDGSIHGGDAETLKRVGEIVRK